MQERSQLADHLDGLQARATRLNGCIKAIDMLEFEPTSDPSVKVALIQIAEELSGDLMNALDAANLPLGGGENAK